ncbi:MAG TPA: NADH-quinone oxidoreductase subunit NuoF [Phycisphaerae bacterium]|nr:NADH-quinone oxidoreductase subunit NuoF [Phycisphaerae bacterium]
MTPEELQSIALKKHEENGKFKHCLHVCVGSGCCSSQADQVLKNLTDGVKKGGVDKDVRVIGVGCMGLCANGPMVSVDDNQPLYQHIKPTDAPTILNALDKAPPDEMVCDTDQPFFKRQMQVVRENSGRVDPEDISDCIAHGAYASLAKALTTMSPGDVIQEVTKSGLRGRGGAGYPTGLKWSTVAKASGPDGRGQKYVVCNGDEGDPGAFMDRSVMEGDPHRVLEGMCIAGYAVGASKGIVYVRAEYPLAVKRLNKAINQAVRNEILGRNILGTNFNFDLEIRLGAGAFVCGEETALIASIEGNRGTPRPRPPYPANSGLFDCPTLINNVETFANIPPIIARGSSWFANIGTEKSKGTKIFALTGKVKNTGLIEVPMGITLREIIYDIGGGIPDGKAFKAVQTGGPSGGCLTEKELDIPVDYESLAKAGSIMGSGGMIVMDETSNMVDVARFFMEFCMSESCGKCIPCRVGTCQMHALLDKIYNRKATPGDLALLRELCDMVKATSLCGLGQTAPNPVLSTLKHFENEYLERIQTSGATNAHGPSAHNGHEVNA